MCAVKLVKVYGCRDYIRTYGLYRSRGVLSDRLRNDFGKYFKSCCIDEAYVEALPGELNDVQGGDETMFLYRYSSGKEWDNIGASTWMSDSVWRQRRYDPKYLKACKEDGRTVEQVLTLNKKMYPEPRFPYKVTLEYDDDDKLFTRLIEHPNIYGLGSRGKIFFPDRDWKGVFGGDARVTVKFSNKSYGVLVGEMRYPHTPNYQELLDYFWKQGLPGGRLIFEFSCAILGSGKFYAMTDYTHRTTLEVFTTTLKSKQNPMGITTMPVTFSNADFKKLNLQHKTVNQMILEDRFDVDLVQRISALGMAFRQCGFTYTRSTYYGSNRRDLPQRALDTTWVRSDDSVSDPVVARAVENGIFTLYNLDGYNIYKVECNVDEFVNFCTYEREDIENVFVAGEAFNKAAEDSIQAKLRKGTLRFL